MRSQTVGGPGSGGSGPCWSRPAEGGTQTSVHKHMQTSLLPNFLYTTGFKQGTFKLVGTRILVHMRAVGPHKDMNTRPHTHTHTRLYLSLRVSQRDAVGADGGPRPRPFLLPQHLRPRTNRVPQRGPLLVHQLLRPLRGPLRLYWAPPLPDAASSCRRPALLFHEQVDVALLRLLLLMFPAFILHHQLADRSVRGNGV